MKTRKILFAIGLLIVLLLGFSQRDRISELGQRILRSDTYSQADGDRPLPLDPESQTTKRLRPSELTIGNLRDLGFEIEADEIRRRSAIGSVTILAPDGTIITGRELQTSSSGDAFILIGDVELQNNLHTIQSEDENAYVKFLVDSGKFSTSDARWEFK